MRALGICWTVVAVFWLAGAPALGSDGDGSAGKLPVDAVPVAYRIELVPDLPQLEAATGRDRVGFSGTVQIDIEVRQPVEALVLNANDISIARATVNDVVSAVEVDARRQVARVVPPQALAAGHHVLRIEYTGTILTHQEGLFYSTYDTPAGRRWVLATDLEPSGARRVFPSWDEPAFKATFALSVTLPARVRAVSNMPIVSERTDGSGRKIVTFGQTPRMSTYLFVLAAGEYDRIAATVEGVDVGVMVPGHLREQGRYALDVAVRALAYFNDYFGVKYPLPKLDNILVPRNFSGAMENWGGVIYSEPALLFDPKTGSSNDRRIVHEYVVHELAHQWFGNLVTMKWWDELWLNEGFASWMEKKLTDEFNPSMKVWVRARADKEKAMAKDALRTSHPVRQPIDDESQALAAFDDITYLKGLNVVRMLEAYVGEAAFRDGLRRYMAAHAYSNATSADLWTSLEAASNKQIAAIATWLSRQPGVPLVRVTTQCTGNQLVVTLRQDRYVLNDPYAARQTWQLPVAIGRPGDDKPSRMELVDGPHKTVTFDGCDRPVKVNYGDVGYYRVHYDRDSLRALAASYHRLDAADRVSLMADAWAMVKAGLSPPADYLELTGRLSDEAEFAVWDGVIESLRFIDGQYAASPQRQAFRAFAQELLRPAFNRLGWEATPGEDTEAALLRNLLIVTLAAFDDPEITAEARRRFVTLAGGGADVAPALRDPVARAVAYAANRQAYDELLRLARAQEGEQERMLYYTALAGARDGELIERTVQIARSDPKLPPSQTLRFLEQASRESGDPDRVWKLVFPHRKEILGRLSGLEQQQGLSRIARASANPAVALELRWADTTRAERGARRFADEAAEEIELKANLAETLIPAVQQWIGARRNR